MIIKNCIVALDPEGSVEIDNEGDYENIDVPYESFGYLEFHGDALNVSVEEVEAFVYLHIIIIIIVIIIMQDYYGYYSFQLLGYKIIQANTRNCYLFQECFSCQVTPVSLLRLLRFNCVCFKKTSA
jgi:hypothetical protein